MLQFVAVCSGLPGHRAAVHLDPVDARGARRTVAAVTDCAGRERRESQLVDLAQVGRRHVGTGALGRDVLLVELLPPDRKSTRLNSSHSQISYAVFCLKKKKKYN